MSNWLKALSFWIWGLIAVGIAASLVSVSYRMVSLYRTHSTSLDTPAADSKATVGISSDSSAATSTQPTISRAISKEYQAARDAYQSGQWIEVIKNLEAAEAKSGLTNFDVAGIQDMKGYAYIKLNNSKDAELAYQAALAADASTPEQLARIFRMLFQLAAQNRHNAAAIEYGKVVTQSSAAVPRDFLLESQLYYLQEDCKDSAVWADKAIAAYHEANEPPKELLYQLKLQCASNAGDTPGMIASLTELVRLTDKVSYLNNLIRLQRQDERDDANTFR